MRVCPETSARTVRATAAAASSEMASLARVRGRETLAGRLTMLPAAAMVVLIVLAISDGSDSGSSAALTPADVPGLGGPNEKPELEVMTDYHAAAQKQPWWELFRAHELVAIAAAVLALLILAGCVARCILARRARYLEERVDTLLTAHNEALSAAHFEAYASDKVALGGQALFPPPEVNEPKSNVRSRSLSDLNQSGDFEADINQSGFFQTSTDQA